MSSRAVLSSAGAGGGGVVHAASPGLVLLQSCWEIPYIAHFTWLFQQPLRMSPIPPETLERLLLHGCEEGREPEARQMRELLTRLAISRRSAADARLIAQLKKGDACGWQHIHAIVRQRLEAWWHEWREDDDDDQQNDDDAEHEATNGSAHTDGDEEKKVQLEDEDEESSAPLPGQSHDYTGPDFATFGLSCPLPASFTFFSLALHQRVVLLRCLCDDHLAFAADFASTVRGVEARDARIPPLGSDSWGHRYFFFGFPDWRVYREDNAKPVKPRELKKDRVKRQQAERGKGPDSDEERHSGEDADDDGDDKEERKESGSRKTASTAVSKGKQGRAARKKAEDDASEPSTPSSKGDDEADSAAPLTRSASTSPRFQLLTSSADALLALIASMRRSAYSRDKLLSKQLQAVYDDLQQGGRKDSDEQAEDGSGAGDDATRKRKRKDWGSGGEVAKRSMRLMLVMAEKEEQERQQRVQAEERRKRVEEMKDESIASLAAHYLERHTPQRTKRKRKR